MKKLLFAFGLLVSLLGKAQTVTIPDTAFANWIQLHFPWCINGNQLDTFKLDSGDITIVSIENTNIINLSGLERFKDINLLNLYKNLKLTTLSILPDSLRDLILISNDLLTNIPALPNSLISLYSDSNVSLTNLPNLPISLIYLTCINMQNLSLLPVLPNYLISFTCSNNALLLSIPTLPNSLEHFFCNSNNLIISLPNFANSLKLVELINNPILDSLPKLPDSLKLFFISENPVLLKLPTLPHRLIRLQCTNNNSLTNLPNLPNTLKQLECNDNMLLSYLPNLPNSLIELTCSNCNLTSLPPLPNGILSLNCSNNNLLDLPKLPNSLGSIDCSFNPNLNCINNIPNSILFWPYDFRINNTGISCVPNYTNSVNPNQGFNLPLCQTNNLNYCNSQNIDGTIYSDTNNDCSINYAEPTVNNLSLKLTNLSTQTSLYASTYYNGLFGYLDVPNGNYNLKIDSLPIFFQACPSSHTFILNTSNPDTTSLNFGIQCKTNFFDLGVKSIMPVDFVFPGQVHQLNISAGNVSQFYQMDCKPSQIITGNVTVNISGPVKYVAPASNALIPNTVSNNILTYSIPNVSSIDFFKAFNVILKTDTTAQLNDSVCVSVNITTPQIGDVDLANNTFRYCYLVVNSYDPNIKVVNKEVVKPSFNDWLTYTIYFQNTGTAPAFNIKLKDTLSTLLDLETFEIIGYSHPNGYTLNSTTRELVVTYPNILLPDSNTNPLGSIGYIQYSIKPNAPMALNSQIKNKASIYFDFNAPIVTNTVTTTATNNVGLASLNNKKEVMGLYPNPASQSLHVTLGKEKIDYISITELSGKVLLKKKVNVGDSKIYFDLSTIENGLYLVNGYVGEKIVKGKKLVVSK
jgi:uncharacterized repeat protein (TIGR01451 family)